MTAPTAAISRSFLLQRDAILCTQPPLLHLYTKTHAFTRSSAITARYASSASSKPRILAKPERFVPPSHPAKHVKTPKIRNYGPALTEEQREEHRTKQYPHTAPPEGTFMHWFLNNRTVHIYIALSVLFFFAGWTFLLNFKASSPYVDLVPTWSEFFRHPIGSIGKWLQILKLHVAHESEETAKRRQRRIEETQKTKAYRVAHGLEPAEGQGIGLGKVGAAITGQTSGGGQELTVAEQGSGTEYVDFEGNKRRYKKWFGIWG